LALADQPPSSGKLTLSTSNSAANREGTKTDSPRTFSAAKRFGGDSSHGGKNPFNAVTPGSTTGVASPSVGGSSAFGLGSGAFASFGSSKAKTPGPSSEQGAERAEKEPVRADDSLRAKKSSASIGERSPSSDHPIKNTWVVWYRPPTSKYSDYEKSTIALASFGSVETFWNVYTHLKRPSGLPSVSDYHIFKKGIRPVWEDEGNKRGGKWIVRLKKGVADRYWEDLLLAIVGDQFAEAGEEVCGAVLSVRSGEDVLSIWTRMDGGRNIKIR
jgi:translation initiation factor 4E